jgi:hypothetical protein
VNGQARKVKWESDYEFSGGTVDNRSLHIRVEGWRAHGRVRWRIHGFRSGPQL